MTVGHSLALMTPAAPSTRTSLQLGAQRRLCTHGIAPTCACCSRSSRSQWTSSAPATQTSGYDSCQLCAVIQTSVAHCAHRSGIGLSATECSTRLCLCNRHGGQREHTKSKGTRPQCTCSSMRALALTSAQASTAGIPDTWYSGSGYRESQHSGQRRNRRACMMDQMAQKTCDACVNAAASTFARSTCSSVPTRCCTPKAFLCRCHRI